MLNNHPVKRNFILALTGLIVSFFIPQSVLAVADSQLWLENPTSSTLKVHLNTNSNQAVGAEVHLQFDPQFIRINSITPDTFFTNPNVIDLVIDNDSGITSIVILAPPTQPQTGNGSLVNVDFSTLKTGTTKINFTDKTKIAALGEVSNSLRDKQDLSFEITQITINNPLSPTPTILLRQTLTPSPEPSLTTSSTIISTLDIIRQPQTLALIGLCFALIILILFVGFRQIHQNSSN